VIGVDLIGTDPERQAQAAQQLQQSLLEKWCWRPTGGRRNFVAGSMVYRYLTARGAVEAL